MQLLFYVGYLIKFFPLFIPSIGVHTGSAYLGKSLGQNWEMSTSKQTLSRS